MGKSLAGAYVAISATDEGNNITMITKTTNLKSGNTPKVRENQGTHYLIEDKA